MEQAEADPEQVVKQPRTKRKRDKDNVNLKNVKKSKKVAEKPVKKTETDNKKIDQNKKQKVLTPNGDFTKKEKKEKSLNNTLKLVDKEATHKNDKKVIVIRQKAKNYQKQTLPTREVKSPNKNISVDSINTQKRVKFALKNNSMQATVDYYKSLRSSPNIPFDATKKPTKTNLKPNSTPSPINPFFKRKLNLKRPPFKLP